MEKENLTKEVFMSLTLRKLEAKTGIPNSHWSDWFNGKRSPTLKKLELMAERLGVPLGELVEWVRERRNRTIKRKAA